MLTISVMLMSCEEDQVHLEKTGKPVVTVDNNELTVTEGQTATFNFTVEYETTTKIDVRIDVLDANGNPIPTAAPSGEPTSGNGFYDRIDLDDINVPYNTWFESGWFEYGYLGGTGYVTTFAPGTLSFSIDIETLADGITEGTESVKLRFSSTSEMATIINETVTINIQD